MADYVELRFQPAKSLDLVFVAPDMPSFRMVGGDQEIPVLIREVMRGPIGNLATEVIETNGDDPVVIDLTDARTGMYELELTGNPPLTFVGSAAVNNKPFRLLITQGAPGGWSPVWQNVHFGSDVATIDLSPDENAIDCIGFLWRENIDEAALVAFVRGY